MHRFTFVILLPVFGLGLWSQDFCYASDEEKEKENTSSLQRNLHSYTNESDTQKLILTLSKLGTELQEETADIYRLGNVMNLLQNPRGLNPLCLLKNISHQIDAMSVQKRFLRDRFQNALSWNLLSFMHHGLSLPGSEVLSNIITQEICNELPQIQTILSRILNLERMKFDILILQRKVPLNIEKESRRPDKDSNMGFWRTANSKNQQRMRDIQSDSLLTHEKRTFLCMEIAEEIAKHSNQNKLLDLLQKKKKKLSEMEANLNREKSALDKVSLPHTQGLLAILYEFESLQIVHNYINVFQSSGNEPSLHAILEAVRILGEGVNNIYVANDTLGIQVDQDLLKYRPSLKYLRNQLEHPEDYQKNKLLDLSSNSSLAPSLSKALYEELMKIDTKVGFRLKALITFLSPDGDLESRIKALIGQAPLTFFQENTPLPTKANQYRQLLKQAHWQPLDIPLLQMLRRYLFHPSYQIESLDHEEDLNAKAKSVLTKECGESKPKGISSSIAGIIAEIQSLEDFLKSKGPKNELAELLKNNIGDKLILYSKISNVFRMLDRKVEDMKFLETIKREHYKDFRHSYFDLRERRNFNTHDLWRTDLQGTLNTAYRLIYNLKYILNRLKNTQLLQGIINKELSAEEVKKLITSEGLNINKTDESLRSPLHHAVNNNNLEIAGVLLELGADPHRGDNRGERPLHYAARDGSLELVQLLLSYGALPDVKDDNGKKPLHHALDGDQKEIASFLKSQAGIFRGESADSIHLATELFDISQVKKLISEGTYLNAFNTEGELPLVRAIEQEFQNSEIQFQIIKMLVEAGADVNKPQILGLVSPLYAAAEYSQDLRVLQFLLENGATPNCLNNCDSTPLHVAAIVNNYEFCKFLLENGADINLQDQINGTPILAATNTTRLNPNIIELLLQHGANPNDENRFGTVLHQVAERGTAEAVEMLLKAGANPFKKGIGGLYQNKTPIEVTKNKEIKELLQQKMKELSSKKTVRK
jgi:ankyrin repeat protein/Na+-transporting NADH:ubiquinone oxidoreductase subunit NqrC